MSRVVSASTGASLAASSVRVEVWMRNGRRLNRDESLSNGRNGWNLV